MKYYIAYNRRQVLLEEKEENLDLKPLNEDFENAMEGDEDQVRVVEWESPKVGKKIQLDKLLDSLLSAVQEPGYEIFGIGNEDIDYYLALENESWSFETKYNNYNFVTLEFDVIDNRYNKKKNTCDEDVDPSDIMVEFTGVWAS